MPWKETNVIEESGQDGLKEQSRAPKNQPRAVRQKHVIEPNDVWCADFKGYFMVGNGKRCDPLTITDAYSRFLLACKITSRTDTENVQAVFTEVFRKYGLLFRNIITSAPMPV